MLHLGQMAETISTSRAISCPQPVLPLGSGAVALWPETVKWATQPLVTAEVQMSGSPTPKRYLLTSLTTLGSAYASTIATVCPVPAVALGSPYAPCSCAGP